MTSSCSMMRTSGEVLFDRYLAFGRGSVVDDVRQVPPMRSMVVNDGKACSFSMRSAISSHRVFRASISARSSRRRGPASVSLHGPALERDAFAVARCGLAVMRFRWRRVCRALRPGWRGGGVGRATASTTSRWSLTQHDQRRQPIGRASRAIHQHQRGPRIGEPVEALVDVASLLRIQGITHAEVAGEHTVSPQPAYAHTGKPVNTPVIQSGSQASPEPAAAAGESWRAPYCCRLLCCSPPKPTIVLMSEAPEVTTLGQ